MSEDKNQFKFHSIQFVLFPEFFNMPEPNKRSEFLAKFKERFSDAQETILPIPNDAPKDIPTMILNVQNSYSIRFAQSRIDFHFNSNSKEEKSIEHIFSSEFKPLANDLVKTIEDNLTNTIKIKKVGCIIRSYIEAEQPASKFENIIKERTEIFDFSNTSEFMIRNLKKRKLKIKDNNFKINEIVLIKNQELNNNVLFVEFDMNTNPEEKLELDTWKLIGSFLDEEKEKNKDALLKIQNKMLL
jgi:hypothetical protein